MSDYREQIRQAKLELSELRAQMQRLATGIRVGMAADWESRYLAEGFVELEQYANHETT